MVLVTAYFFVALYFYCSYYVLLCRNYPVIHFVKKQYQKNNTFQLRVGCQMKKNKYILLTLILIFCVSSNAQTPDLILQEDIDITYVSYLINQERDEGFELYVIYENVRLMIHLKDLKRALKVIKNS